MERTSDVLRQIAVPVPLALIKTKKFQQLLLDLGDTLAVETDGVALAAPQIDVSRRLFIVSHRFLGNQTNNLICINPVLKKTSRQKVWLEEGCLSVRWLYGKTRRATKVTLEAYDERGQKFTRHASGLLAQVFQHEIDHLNGVLFTDQAKDLKELKPTTT